MIEKELWIAHRPVTGVSEAEHPDGDGGDDRRGCGGGVGVGDEERCGEDDRQMVIRSNMNQSKARRCHREDDCNDDEANAANERGSWRVKRC